MRLFSHRVEYLLLKIFLHVVIALFWTPIICSTVVKYKLEDKTKYFLGKHLSPSQHGSDTSNLRHVFRKQPLHLALYTSPKACRRERLSGRQ